MWRYYEVKRIERGIIAWETDYRFKMSTNLWIRRDQIRVRGNVSKLVYDCFQLNVDVSNYKKKFFWSRNWMDWSNWENTTHSMISKLWWPPGGDQEWMIKKYHKRKFNPRTFYRLIKLISKNCRVKISIQIKVGHVTQIDVVQTD
jgi:hypothetical protein